MELFFKEEETRNEKWEKEDQSDDESYQNLVEKISRNRTHQHVFLLGLLLWHISLLNDPEVKEGFFGLLSSLLS